MKAKGCLIVVSGPSGTGKGTICGKLLQQNKGIAYSVSATTRAPREGEQDGVNYYFLRKEEFERMIAEGELLEWAEVYGNYYGTPLKKIRERLAEGQDVLLEIDTQGALNVKSKMPEAVLIFIMPPSLEELEKRLRGRGTDAEEAILRRLSEAAHEIGLAREYNYVVENDEVAKALAKVEAVIAAEHCRAERVL